MSSSRKMGRMQVKVDASKPQNYRAKSGISFSTELNRLRTQDQFQKKNQPSQPSIQPTKQLKTAFSQYQNGQLNRDKFYNKITNELGIAPNQQLEVYLKQDNPTYTGFIRCLHNRERNDYYTPKMQQGSFTDRQFSHVEQEPSRHSKRQNNLVKAIQQFQGGQLSGDQFKETITGEDVQINSQIEKVIQEQQRIGVPQRTISKAIFSQIRDDTEPKLNPNYQDPTAYKQFNKYDMKLRNIDESKKLYCETHMLIHGKTGATVGKRADCLTKFYIGTTDLLDWEKINFQDEVQNKKKGIGMRQQLLASSDVFKFDPQTNRDYNDNMFQSKRGKNNVKQSSGDIISWTNSNEPEQISAEHYFYTKNNNFCNR